MNLTQAETLDRLQEIFRDVLDRPSLRITPDTAQAHLPEWDSMAQVHLILSIEQEFRLRLTAREASEMVSVGAILDLIVAKA